MTIKYRDYLRLPSYDLYLNCVRTKTYPFRKRAKVINQYRRMVRLGIADLTSEQFLEYQDKDDLWRKCTPFEPTPAERRKRHVQVKEHFETKEEERLAKKKRSLARRFKTIIKGKEGRKNAKVYNALAVVIRLTSGGKGRPSRKVKKHFIRKVLTVHLKGNKYSGGQEKF